MAGAQLLHLFGPQQVGLVGEMLADSFPAVPIHHVDGGRLQFARCGDHVGQHRLARYRLQHLGQHGFHALSSAGGGMMTCRAWLMEYPAATNCELAASIADAFPVLREPCLSSTVDSRICFRGWAQPCSSLAVYYPWRAASWSRFAELVEIGLFACGAGVLLKRWRHWSMASVLGVLWLLLLPVFAGVLAFLSALLMLLAAAAIGTTLFAQRALALQACAGLLVMAAVLGWTLLLPIHYRWIYLLACPALVAWRSATLRSALRAAATQWRHAVAAAPRSAAFAVLVLGLASTACWLPTLQYDDLTYHLRLPWQLMELGVPACARTPDLGTGAVGNRCDPCDSAAAVWC